MRRVLGLAIICLIVSSIFLPLIKADLGLDLRVRNSSETLYSTVRLRSRAYDGATNVGGIGVLGVGFFDLPADIYLEDGEYTVVGSGGIFDGNKYAFDKWEGPVANPSEPATILSASGEVTLTLVLFKWDFDLDVSPSSNTVRQGDGALYEVTVTATGGWTTETGENVRVQVEILDTPTGITKNFAGSFMLSQSNPSDTHACTIYTSETDTPTGTYSITFEGTIESTTTTHSKTVDLVVEPKEGPLPDLIIEDFWWLPEKPQLGDEVTFTYVEKNQGKGDASAHRNTLLIDDIPISNDVVEALAAGAPRTRTFPDKWIATSGAHDALVKADDQNGVTESDEENNSCEETIGEKEQVSTSLTIDLTPSGIPPNTITGITISGRLTRIDTGTGIPDRPIRLDWTGGLTTVTTDVDGYYSSFTYVGPYEEGTYEFAASFEGYETTSTIFFPSTASITLPVGKIATEITVSLTPSTVEPNTETDVTISGRLTLVNSGAGLGGKTIQFSYDWGGSSSTTTDENGYYSKSVSVSLSSGSFLVTASFEGDSTYAESTASDTLQVTEGPPPHEPMFKISKIFAPSSATVGTDFYISVITSYSFISETNVIIGIWDYSNNKQIAVKEDTLSGDGFRPFDFKLNALSYSGTWRLLVNASYMQNNLWKQETVGGQFHVSINIVEGEVPIANFRVTPLYFNVEYNGEIFKAFLTENLTAPDVPPRYEDTDAFYKWIYSRFNWYVLSPDGDLVADESIYVEVAFVAQIAYLGISVWLPQNLRVQSEQFEEVMALGVRAEICKKVGSLAAGMIPSVVTGGVPTITKEIVSQTLAMGIAKGFTDPEVLFTFFIANHLEIAAEKLESAAGSIEPIYDEVLEKGFPHGVLVSQNNMAKFYYNITTGKTYGYSAMKALAERFDEGIWGYLGEVIKAAVFGTLPEPGRIIVEKIDSLIEEFPEFRAFWEEMEKMNKFYDMRERTFKEYARKFSQVFIEGEAFATLVSAETPSGEKVNFLASTNSTILSKYASTMEKSITIEVDGPTGETGTFSISISKDILTSTGSTVEKILVTVDGKISPFVVEEQTESYIIYINYSHSQRVIKIYYSSCSLKVNVVGARDQPLSGSKVLLLWSDGNIFDVKTTDTDGYAYFNKVPLGNFTLKTEYKGFFVLQLISIVEPQEARISLDVAIEILGFTLTTLNTVLLVSLLIMVVTLVLTIVTMKRRKQKSIQPLAKS